MIFNKMHLKDYIIVSFEEKKQINDRNFINFNKDGFDDFNQNDVSVILKELYDEEILDFNKPLNYLILKNYKIENMKFIE